MRTSSPPGNDDDIKQLIIYTVTESKIASATGRIGK
jgi:hypothetical protein